MSAVYDLGPFRLHVEKKTLTKAGIPVALGVHAVGVLTALVERAPGLVSKPALLDAVWPKVVVEEGNISTQVYTIRRVLAQVPGGDRWIETLSGRGYRYVGPLAKLTSGEHAEARHVLSNLAEPLTSFIGRERELIEVKRLLATKRLITIVGPGGIGKTRLALRTAGEAIDAYRDGAWLAELASTHDADLVPAVVAQVFGVPEKSGTPVTQSLRAFFKSRQLLLVLDNCEHVIESCAKLVDELLREAPGVSIIATSREPLRVLGEQIYALQPLSLPDPGADIDALRGAEAVQLLIDRIQLQIHDFDLTPARIASIGALCVHLDGIPLALELAAARVRSLSVDEINARVAERFSLLTVGPRMVLARQQTLRATLDWSYDLLRDLERVALRRCSIFPGIFTTDAAAAVVCDASIDELALTAVLPQLIGRSLVIADTRDAGTQYRMLETTRAYAHEKLDESGEVGYFRRRHAEYFRDFFQDAPNEWLRGPNAQWRAKYLPELPNLRAALEWALADSGDATIAISIAGSSAVVFAALGLFGEGIRWCERAMARIDAHTSLPDQARLWLWFGRLVDELPARSRPAFEHAVGLYRKIGDGLGLGLSLARLARALTYLGLVEEAEASLAEARPLLDAPALPVPLSLYFFTLAFLKNYSGDAFAARSNYEKALTLYQASGDEYATLATMGNIANANWVLGDLEKATTSYRDLLTRMRASPISTRRILGYALLNLGGLLTERGELDEALVLMREGLPLVREDGSAWLFFDDLALRAALAGKLVDGARLAGYADSMHSVNAAARSHLTARHRTHLQTLLQANVHSDELERLFAEGANLSEDEACRLAVAD